MSAPRKRTRTRAASGGGKKAEFSPKEIAAMRTRLKEEMATSNVVSRRSRLAQAAGLGSVGGLSADAPAAGAGNTVGSSAGTTGARSATTGTAAAGSTVTPPAASTGR